MFLQPFIIILAMPSIVSSPIMSTTTTTTTTSGITTTTVTSPSTTRGPLTISLSTIDVVNLSTTTVITFSSTNMETITTTEMSPHTTRTAYQTTTISMITKTTLMTSNRSCTYRNGSPGWLCDDKTCIWLAAVCGGKPTCPDGSDEIAGCSEDPTYCQFEGGIPGWKCDSGECINKLMVCDSTPQCGDGSDEKSGCAQMDLVPCPTNNNTLTERWAANVDCRECWDYTNNWRCDNGHCTGKVQMCNGIPNDCLDGSDEWEGCERVTCGNDSSITTAAMFADGDCRRCWNKKHWRCNDGRCITKTQLCDGDEDCTSGEDETIGCSRLVSCFEKGVHILTDPKFRKLGQCRSCDRTFQWRCNSGQCINKKRKCNNVMFGNWDCRDGSDEEPGSGCPSNVTCISDKSIVTTPHFSTGTVEKCLSCSGKHKAKVAYNYKRCKSGQCKKRVYFCNGYEDCSDGSDEIGCNLFAYFDTKQAIMLSFGLVAMTTYLYIKFLNFHSLNLTCAQKKYPRKTPRLYKNIKKYCDILELDIDNNANSLKKLHISIRNKKNGLRQLIIAITSIYSEPQLCHKYCNKVLNIENEFHRNNCESLMYIRLTAGSNEYTEIFANAIEPPGFIAKLSFSFANLLEYVSTKIGLFMHLIKVLIKMILFYLDVIKDVALFFKLWHIVSQLEETNILHHVLVYISCIFIFLAQSVIGFYLVIQLGKPQESLPPSLIVIIIFLLFLMSPLIPIILVIKESLLNSDIEEKKCEMKNNKTKGLTKFLTFISYANKKATETKAQFSFHIILNSILESLPQLIIYTIFCLTYYYDNSLVPIIFSNHNTSNTILFALSIPLSLFSLVNGISTYSSMNGKSHYTKKISYFFQIISRVCAILSFISPLYALYFTNFKTIFEKFVNYPSINNYSWIQYFFTSSLISITYPNILSLFFVLSIIFGLHGVFIYFYSHKNIPGFSDSSFFHKLIHTLANTFMVLPWRPLGQEDQRRKSQEHQNYHFAMAVSNILIIIFSSICREYNNVNYTRARQGTKLHLEWLHHFVSLFLPSNLPLLEKLSPYHYTIGLLLNMMAHIPWLLLVLLLQGLSVFSMSIYYKKFHPWRTIINTANVNKNTTIHEILSIRNDVLEIESEVEWVDEHLMEVDTDTDEENGDPIANALEEGDINNTDENDSHKKKEKQYELQKIIQHSSMRHKLDHDRSILMKSLVMQQKKRENSRREFFSEMTKTQSNVEKVSGETFLTKRNHIKVQVQVHQNETKKREEPYELKEMKYSRDNKPDAIALDFINTITEDEKPDEKDQQSDLDICRELLLDLIDKAIVEDFMEEVEFNNQHLCEEIILELVSDAMAKVKK